MNSILFICHGNVGRSQMAEAFYNYLTNTKLASSAGIDPTTPSRYEHPTQEIIEVMLEEGIDVSSHEVKLLNQEMVENADQVYVLCEKDDVPEYVSSSNKVHYWEVQDPYRMDTEATRAIRDVIKDRIQELTC